MSTPEDNINLTPIERALQDFENKGSLEKVVDDREIVDYLLYTIRLAKKKTHSKRLLDVVKIKWCKVAVDASKALLFSGVLDKRSKRGVEGYEAFFMSVMKDYRPANDHIVMEVDKSDLE